MRRRLIVPVLAASILGLAACGGSSTAGPSNTAPQQVSNGPSSPAASRPALTPSASTPGAYKRAATTPSTKAVPILIYHVIGTPHPGVAFPGLWVPPADFAAHVKALAAAGYTGVTLNQVIDAWKGKATLPAKPIVLSFDDGYIGQGKEAGPVLQAQGWPGVLYLVLKSLGTPGGLTTSRIKTMIAAGWEVDAHSLTHPDLTKLGAGALEHEVAGSRKVIQDRFGVPVNSFCYPAGKYNATVEKAVKAAGYSNATTEDPGAAKPGDDHYALPRVRVNGGDTAATVVGNVRAAAG